MRVLWLLPYLPLPLAAACGDDSVGCPKDFGVPVEVEVEPNGLKVDSVVANVDGFSEPCEANERVNAAGSTDYHCPELGGVTYRVWVRSEPLVWFKSKQLKADDCRTAENVKFHFELDPDTAVEESCGVDIQLVPIKVTIEPHEFTVDSVTSHNESKPTIACQRGFRSRTMFSCADQGGGTYTVQVSSGDYTWSQSVELQGKGCHLAAIAELRFDLDPETAD